MLTTYDLALKITMAFEGTKWNTVSGNFDGQGISAGALQWNIGQGTLQNHILNHINLMYYDYFPAPILYLQNSTVEGALSWVKDVMLDPTTNGLRPEWKTAWERFLNEPTVINQQKRAIDKYWHQAKTICGKLGMKQDDKRAMCFSFDVAVQNWSLGDLDLDYITSDHAYNCLTLYEAENAQLWLQEDLTPMQQKLVVAAHLRALKANPKWRSDVFTRKATIAVGIGKVHGALYKLNKLFR